MLLLPLIFALRQRVVREHRGAFSCFDEGLTCFRVRRRRVFVTGGRAQHQAVLQRTSADAGEADRLQAPRRRRTRQSRRARRPPARFVVARSALVRSAVALKCDPPVGASMTPRPTERSRSRGTRDPTKSAGQPKLKIRPARAQKSAKMPPRMEYTMRIPKSTERNTQKWHEKKASSWKCNTAVDATAGA